MGCLILCGFNAAGKTTIGKNISTLLNLPFCDTDERIFEKTGEKPRDLFKRVGPEPFRKIEQEIILALEKVPQVVALGGGVLTQEKNVAHLKQIGTLIYLKASLETLWKRNVERGLPAFIKAREEFEQIAEKRFHLFESMSDWTLETDFLTERETSARIVLHYGK